MVGESFAGHFFWHSAIDLAGESCSLSLLSGSLSLPENILPGSFSIVFDPRNPPAFRKWSFVYSRLGVDRCLSTWLLHGHRQLRLFPADRRIYTVFRCAKDRRNLPAPKSQVSFNALMARFQLWSLVLENGRKLLGNGLHFRCIACVGTYFGNTGLSQGDKTW